MSWILSDDLNMHRVTHPVVRWMLIDDQHDEWMTICGKLMTSDNDPLLLESIITGDET
jgi:hypothetical protein